LPNLDPVAVTDRPQRGDRDQLIEAGFRAPSRKWPRNRPGPARIPGCWDWDLEQWSGRGIEPQGGGTMVFDGPGLPQRLDRRTSEPSRLRWSARARLVLPEREEMSPR